jgi:hypothetical protein
MPIYLLAFFRQVPFAVLPLLHLRAISHRPFVSFLRFGTSERKQKRGADVSISGVLPAIQLDTRLDYQP